jgi:2-polyprenyl-6-methoxyphenol hydroxylase-like FAD-dependent oxidoreductase
MPEAPVVVVGGGVAGLGAALALRRRDVPVVVLERAAGPDRAGLAINIPANGIRALARLGLGDAIAAVGSPVRRREYRNARGRTLFAVDEERFWASDGLPGSRCVRRRDLLSVLAGALDADVVRWGVEVLGVRQPPSGPAEIELTGGGAEPARLVVGADGVHSVVRRATVGSATSRAVLSGSCWRLMTPDPGVDHFTVWAGPRGTFLMIPVDADVYCFVSSVGGRDVGTDPAWIAENFAGYPDPVRQVAAWAAAHPEATRRSPIEEVRGVPWSNGRVVLIGDAAHATAPVWAQGAASALEDAEVLAEVLATLDEPHAVGPALEARRRARVEHVQHMTDRLSRAAGLPRWIAEPILPFVGPRTYRETFEPLRAAP